ncbi:MAG: Gfo/Idh/MocA family protein [Actinomycetota bacterium]
MSNNERMLEALGIGIVGYQFMGRAHSHAWRNVASVFPSTPVPRMVALVGRDEAAARSAASRLGWAEVATDWRSLLERTDVDVIDICVPSYAHAAMATAALEAGKHVLCEKPLANTIAEAQAMAEAAERAERSGVFSMVGFNYRRVPALELARRIIAEGAIGEVRHVRAAYLQEWAADEEIPLLWRFESEHAGSGALGDIGSHLIDITQHLLDQRIATVSGLTETFVTKRARTDGGGEGPVTVDDLAVFAVRFNAGATGNFEATRVASGRKNAMRVEIDGAAGGLAFDLERLNELQVYDHDAPEDRRGFRTILVTEESHPWLAAWWPPGHMLGWEHTFTHQAHDFLAAVGERTRPEPGFDEGLQVQAVLEAVQQSAIERRWCDVKDPADPTHHEKREEEPA